MVFARLSACREQIQSPVESGMQNPIYPTRTSRDGIGVLFVLTRFVNVDEMEGFTLLASGLGVVGEV